MKARAAKTAAAMAPAGQASALKAEAAPKKRVSPAKFFEQVMAEAKKITWTSRKETWITSLMVFIMVVMTSIFFFVVDWVLRTGVTQILALANAG
jgi:preprotein translocase subunit SecE